MLVVALVEVHRLFLQICCARQRKIRCTTVATQACLILGPVTVTNMHTSHVMEQRVSRLLSGHIHILSAPT